MTSFWKSLPLVALSFAITAEGYAGGHFSRKARGMPETCNAAAAIAMVDELNGQLDEAGSRPIETAAESAQHYLQLMNQTMDFLMADENVVSKLSDGGRPLSWDDGERNALSAAVQARLGQPGAPLVVGSWIRVYISYGGRIFLEVRVPVIYALNVKLRVSQNRSERDINVDLHYEGPGDTTENSRSSYGDEDASGAALVTQFFSGNRLAEEHARSIARSFTEGGHGCAEFTTLWDARSIAH